VTTGLTGSHRMPSPLSGQVRARLIPALLVLSSWIGGGCPPKIVRIDVPPDSVIRANQVAQEADLAFARRDYYAALIKYLESGRLNPNSEFIQNKIGITYSQLKYYTEATSAFLRSIGLNPKYPYSYNNLGTVYFATNDKKHAEKYFRKAIGLNGDVASFHINLGTLYIEQKRLDRGMAEWKKGLDLDPNALRRNEGISLAAAGSRTNTGERSFFMARLYASLGDVDHAVESLQQALNAGFLNLQALKSEKDFDPIRQDEKFVTFLKTAEVLNKP
jgi:tetratricopeptide (TPR) repeat protein